MLNDHIHIRMYAERDTHETDSVQQDVCWFSVACGIEQLLCSDVE